MKKMLLATVTTLCLTLSFVNNNTYECVNAENENSVCIGKLLTYEHVSNVTKVNILNNEMRLLIIEAGRTIYSDNPGGPIIYSYNQLNQQLSNNEVLVQDDPNIVSTYYYYATPYEPKITGYRYMYNDIDSLVFALELLESEASYYGVTDSKNAILGYIRSMNVAYVESSNYGNNDEWQIVAGDINTAFINNMNALTVGCMEINEYFASFLPSGQYNSTLHKNCRSQYLLNNYPLINNSSSDSAQIDLIHMFASIDGIADGSGQATNSFPYNVFVSWIYDFLSSWGGDLQEACKYVSNDTNLGDYSFDDVLNGNYGFDYLDFYADVDAINIAYNLDLSNCSELSIIVDNYYDDILNNQFNRFNSFLNNVAYLHNNYTNNANLDFMASVYYMLGLTVEGNNNMTLIPMIDEKLYGHLGYPNHPSIDKRVKMANTFCNYIFALAY